MFVCCMRYMKWMCVLPATPGLDFGVLQAKQEIYVGTLRAKQRICLFLTPLPSGEEGDNYFEASNRAVGVYDYDILMERV